MKRFTPAIFGVFALAGWLGAMFLISRFSESGTQRVSATLVEPRAGELLWVDEDGRASLRWELSGANDCAVSLDDGELFTIATDGSATIIVPQDGARSTLLHLTCDGRIVGRYARMVAVKANAERQQLDASTADPRIEVARVHVDAEELERALSEQLPLVLNPILARELRGLAPIVEAESQSWPVPGWLVDGVRLKPSSSVVVRAARLDLDESSFSVALDVDVDLDLAILNRPVIAPSRRGTRTIDFSIQDRFRPVRATLSLHEWPTLRVHGVKLEGSFCRRFDRDIIRNVCNRAATRVYRRLEAVIEDEVRSAAGGLIRSLDLESLLTDAVRQWTASMELEELVDELVADAAFELSRTHQDDNGLHASLTTSLTWLSRNGAIQVAETPAALEVADSSATIDFAVRIALFNRLLAELFDRPLADVAKALEEAGAKYGGGGGLSTLEDFLEDGAAADLSEADNRLFVLLRLASMRVHSDARARPWLYATPNGALSLDTGSVDLFASVDDDVRISVQSIADFKFYEDGGWIALRGPADGLSATLALEPRPLIDGHAGNKAARRAEAAIRVFYRTMSNPVTDQHAVEEADSLSSWMGSSTSARIFPSHYSMGSWSAVMRELNIRHTNQSIELQLEMMTEDSD